MKTNAIANLKDNVGSATLLAALLIAIVGGVINSKHASAQTQPLATQTMETVLVTAQRMPEQQLDTIVVTARR